MYFDSIQVESYTCRNSSRKQLSKTSTIGHYKIRSIFLGTSLSWEANFLGHSAPIRNFALTSQFLFKIIKYQERVQPVNFICYICIGARRKRPIRSIMHGKNARFDLLSNLDYKLIHGMFIIYIPEARVIPLEGLVVLKLQIQRVKHV